MKRNREVDELREWADLVFPWLPPTDLAAVSSACKALRRAAIAVSDRRASDASRGLEKHPIPFLNHVDAQPYSYFLYARYPILGSSSHLPSSRPWGVPEPSEPVSDPSFPADLAVGGSVGCACEDCSTEESGDLEGCPCSTPKLELSSGLDDGMELIRECGPKCSCWLECANRSTQRGVAVKLRIVKDMKKGWGLHAAQFVPRGEFVCEYAGEYLTTEEARRRQRTYDDELASNPALLVVREHLPSGRSCLRVNIDATKVGNVARFINHSCDGGNLVAVLARNSGSLLPRLCFFAAADILEGEELTFSYGDFRPRPKSRPCFCGSSVCFGVLPSEET